MKKHLLIAVEGPDGVGKTTTCGLLKKTFQRIDVPVEVFRPVYAPFGEWWRYIRTAAPATKAFFWLTAVCYQATRVEEALKSTMVICDRYIYSALVYARVRGIQLEVDIASLMVRIPDHTFLLTAETPIIQERLSKRKQRSPFDEEAFTRPSTLGRVISEFQKFDLHCIDTTELTPQEVAEKIYSRVSGDHS